MTKQLFILTACLVPAAFYTTYSRAQPHVQRNEAWVESRVPTEVAGYTFLPSTDDPLVSYKMDETTYRELEPLGIVAQVYEDNKAAQYEVVVIAGDRMANFHDQRVCFVAQGWNLTKNDIGKLSTSTFGDVPVLDLTVTKDGRGQRPALFMWRSSRQFTNDRKVAKSDFFLDGLLGKPNMVGYRWIFRRRADDSRWRNFLDLSRQGQSVLQAAP